MKKHNLLILLFLVFYFQVSAQNKIITGSILDENAEPAIGATIRVKGATSHGTTANIDGKFSIEVSQSTTTLLISYVGYEATEVNIAGKTQINVVLLPTATALKEVVAVGYGVQKKATMTGSVVTIDTKELLKTPAPNMATALIGRTPGLITYQKSGQPGMDNITLRIRGVETSNNAEPLILVDGVERDFTQLDPNEIESISILKDAASTAVFGIRGANGVMIVNTKKGQEGPVKINLSSNLSFQQPTRMPKLIDAEGFMRMYNEALINDNPTATPFFNEATIQQFLSNENPVEYPNNDWMKVILKPFALQQQHNLTLSGGTKLTKYYTSIGYYTQDGLIRDFAKEIEGRQLNNQYNYNRLNLRSNIDIDVTPSTKIGVMLSGIIGKTTEPLSLWNRLISTTPISGPTIYQGKLVGAGPSSVSIKSPLIDMTGASVTDNNRNTIGFTFNFNQKLDFLLKGLTLRGIASYDSYYLHKVSRSQGDISYYIVYLPDENGNVTMQLKPSGEDFLVRTTDSWDRNRKIHTELALEYSKSIKNHNFSSLLLGTADKKWYSTVVSQDKYYSIPMSYLGLVGRFTYDYSMKYLLELNLGYNGSENFPAKQRFALFPAVSIGWNIAEEKFVKRIIDENILGKFKVRASYGMVGNDVSIGYDMSGNLVNYRFLYLSTPYYVGGGAILGDYATPVLQGGYVEGSLGNENVTWEIAKKSNLGLEISMFKNQLLFNLDLFRSEREGILMRRNTLPIHTGLPLDIYNLGSTINHGFEVESTWRQQMNHFSYHLGGNFSYARNKWIEMDEIKDINNPSTWQTGRSIGQNFGYLADGFFNSYDEIARGPVLGNPGLGETRYVDVNGDGEVNTKDIIPIGYPELPEIFFGVNSGISYKGFSFSILFQGATHTSKIMRGKFQKPFDNNGGLLGFTVAERWTPENAEIAKRPRLTLNYANPTSYLPSTLWLRDGSYVKLRNVEFAYQFDRSKVKKILGVNGLGLYIQGQNLFIWDKLKYIDPEGNTNDNFQYPQVKVYNVGFKVEI